jgi:histidinol-phosphate aminotransferase
VSERSEPREPIVAVRDDLQALRGYHSAQVDVEVRLNTNESPYPPPAQWEEELAAALTTIDWRRYPDRAATALRSAIAEWHGVAPANVFAANGSNEVLQTLLLTYTGPGRAVLTFEPTYQLHSHIARLAGAVIVQGERRSDFTLDVDAAERMVADERPAVTFLCSPNNPTGLVEEPSTVHRLLAVASGLVVVDEAYAQFADWSALDLVGEDVPLAVVRTFSKTWSMAAARLGYLIGPTWLVDALQEVVLPYHLDAVKQVAGRLALDHVDEMDARVKLVVAERERISEELARMAVDVFPSGANFVLLRPKRRPGHEVWEGLVARGVLVRDCSRWSRLDDCLRVTVGTPEEDDRFLGALRDVLDTVSS